MADLPFSNIGLHHIGHLVADIGESAAQYEAALGYRVESAVIADPEQTALVQFLRLPSGAHWLELISPDGPSGKLATALQKGGGLHHACYEVQPLEQACDHFRAKGWLPLSAPEPARAFPGRRIAWFMDRRRFLLELVEAGEPPLSLKHLLRAL